MPKISSAKLQSFPISSAIFLPFQVLMPIITFATFSSNHFIFNNRTIFIHLPETQFNKLFQFNSFVLLRSQSSKVFLAMFLI